MAFEFSVRRPKDLADLRKFAGLEVVAAQPDSENTNEGPCTRLSASLESPPGLSGEVRVVVKHHQGNLSPALLEVLERLSLLA